MELSSRPQNGEAGRVRYIASRETAAPSTSERDLETADEGVELHMAPGVGINHNDYDPRDTPSFATNKKKGGWQSWVIGAIIGTVIFVIGIGVGMETTRAGSVPQPLLVLVLGDWGRRGENNQKGTADAMGRVASKHDISFVISTGDNFYPSGLRGPKDLFNFEQSFSEMYTAPSLKDVPWHAVLGNHDYGDGNHSDEPDGIACTRYEPANPCSNVGLLNECCYDPLHQLDPRYRESEWGDPRWHAYRSHRLTPEERQGDTDFFLIDTNAMMWEEYKDDPWYDTSGEATLSKQSATAALRELEAGLSSSNAKWKIVVGHHPVYSFSDHGDSAFLIENLLPILKKHKVALYLNGHDHCMQVIEKETDFGSITFVTSGAGSELGKDLPGEEEWPPEARLLMNKNGFALLKVASDSLTVEVYDAEDPSQPRLTHEIIPPL